MTERWQFEKVGMTYRCWNDEIQTEFRLKHLKRSHGDLNGEISVITNIANVKTHKGVLHVARLNVLSSSSRASLARMLEKRTPGQDMDWFDGLEWLCQNVIITETTGEPIDEVGLEPATPPGHQWMVEPIILKGRPSMVFGPGGVGKSLLGLTCGMSVANGREIIPGIAPAVKGPVLYLDWETTRDVINDRIQAIGAGHGFKPSGMLYRRCVRPLADDAEELSAIVAEKGVVLVIVDSAAYAMGAQGEYGDANESVLRLHEGLRLMDATALIIDHVAKTDLRARPGTATPYGSAYKTNAARISWEVRKAPSANGLAINLYHAKSNDTRQLEPIGLALEWDDGIIRFSKAEVIVDEEPETGRLTTAERIKEVVSGGEHWKIEAISRILPDIPYDTIKKTCSRMVQRSELYKDDHGNVYEPPRGYKLRSLPGSRGLDA